MPEFQLPSLAQEAGFHTLLPTSLPLLLTLDEPVVHRIPPLVCALDCKHSQQQREAGRVWL